MSNLKASVVLCTFQGERFLSAQLQSLHAQSRPAFEILARDDGSSDGTLGVLKQHSVAFKQNSKRLGFAQNFAAACGDANGDLIFLCDQDDIWEPSKIEVMSKLFESDPTLQVACSEGLFIDEKGEAIPGKILEGNGLSPSNIREWEAGEAFRFLLRRNPVPGMTMVIRRSFLSLALPIPEGWEHDYWFLLLAAGLGQRIAVVGQPLVRYRQHSTQAVGGSRSLSQRWRAAGSQGLSARAAESKKLGLLVDRLSQWGGKKDFSSLAEEKRAHLARRGSFSSSRLLRAVEISRELAQGGYHRFEAGLSSAVKDWLATS